MDDLQEFHNKLSQAIAVKSENLEKTTVRRLRDHLQGFEAGVSAMYKFLIDKGLMQNDPYKGERTVTEIQTPSADIFTDGDVSTEISMRFSHYVSQWEFLVNIFHVSISNLTLKKVKRILDLLDWVRWTDFSPNSALQVTRAVAKTVGRVSKMNDPMAGKIMSSSATHLRELTHSIRKELEVVTEFLRENYKWKVREDVTSRMKIDPAKYNKNPMATLDNLKFEITHNARRLGWYKELAQELLEEDFGSDANILRTATIERLKVTSEKKKKKSRRGPDNLMLLMAVVEKLSRCGEPIRSAMIKMNVNSQTIQGRKKGLGERLSEIFSSIFSRHDTAVIYQITITNTVTGSVRHESLDFRKFYSIAVKRAQVLQDLLDPSSVAYTNAKATGIEKLEDYVSRFLVEVKSIHRRLEGLEAYFKSDNVPMRLRDNMKTTGLSLKNLKSSISETMKTFNEYKIGKEERDQLRKLGIED